MIQEKYIRRWDLEDCMPKRHKIYCTVGRYRFRSIGNSTINQQLPPSPVLGLQNLSISGFSELHCYFLQD